MADVEPDPRPVPPLRGLPWLGRTLAFMRDVQGLLEHGRQRHGDAFRYEVTGEWLHSMQDPQCNAPVLVDPEGQYSSREAWEVVLAALFPNGLMLMDGERHAHHRGILRTAFGRTPMEGYLAQMPPVIARHVADWRTRDALQMYPAMKRLTLALAGRVFFGLDFDQGNGARVLHDIEAVVQASTALPVNLPFTTYGRGLRARARLEAFFRARVAQRRADPQADLFSILCTATNEAGTQLADDAVVDHLIFILMAAHDTTASALTSVCYELARHPAWQARLRVEAQALDLHAAASLAPHALKRALPLTDRVIRETLRLHPPLVVIPRKTRSPQVIAGYALPSGVTVQLPIHHHHRHPDLWTDPDRFDPDRFAAPIPQARALAYLPFGAGAHHCLGASFADLQMRLVIAHLVRAIRWSVPHDYVADFQRVPIQAPRDGLPVTIEAL